MSWTQAMQDTLQKLRDAGGEDWYVKLANEMTTFERAALREALEQRQLNEPAPPPSGTPLTEPAPFTTNPPLIEPAPPPPGRPMNG